jgi:SynChlorMet cassette protein ScmC
LGDDEVLIVAREDGTFYAHPFPTWSDLFFQRRESPRAWRTSFGVRLSGIYFLEQAAIDRSAPLERQQAPMRITSGSLQAMQRFQHLLPSAKKRELYRRIFDNACQMVKRVPCHSLKATLNGSFWEEMG